IAFADEYLTAFKDMVKSCEIKGLNHTTGLQGKFRTAAGALAVDLQKHQLDEVYVSLLLVRRYEKDYMRTKSDKYKTKFLAAVKTYKTILGKSTCEKTSKDVQQKALTAYSNAFNAYLVAKTPEDMDKTYNGMRTQASVMETAIKSAHVPRTKALLLDIRKNEKDYLLRSDVKYVKKTHAACAKLIATCEQAGVLKEHVEAVKTAVTGYQQSFDALVDEDGKIATLVATMRKAVHAIEPAVAAIHEHALESVEQASEKTTSEANTLALTAMCISIGAGIVGVMLAFVITRGITKPINQIVQGLTAGAEQTSSASGQVASASQSLAQGTSEQAASIEEVTSSIEEMTSMTKQNATNADEAKSLSANATAGTGKGTEAMGRMSVAIEDIKTSSDETAKIIKTIDEIAFQTNLLALNAAVEAARAGEAGKGFAVVAEEVRNLAQRSAQAARDTAEMIEGSVKNADNGVIISKEVASLLEDIAGDNGKVNDLVAEIAAASNEQAQGIDQINTAVSQMDQVTQSNAANAEESASAAEELSAQAEQLGSMVIELQGMVGGSAADSGSSFKADRKPKAKNSKPQPSETALKRPTMTPATVTNENEFPMDEDSGLDSF
ncbi:MAG: hypothetical protein GY794_07080, partial [bacterium]|nr:hypothetical protein [bacterium]